LTPTRSAFGGDGRTRAALNAARLALLAFLFPDTCVACGTALAAAARHLCPTCSLALSVHAGTLVLPGRERAREPDAPPACAFYALEFEGVTRSLIHELKYRGRESIAGDLAALAGPVARLACVSPPDVVTPVPLHPVRLRERGFNQSALLARELAGLVDAQARDTLRRVHHSPPQASLSRAERLVLPAAGFRAARKLSGLRVLLVDDVVTTGATLAAASVALLEGGAAEVICFALAGTATGTSRVQKNESG